MITIDLLTISSEIIKEYNQKAQMSEGSIEQVRADANSRCESDFVHKLGFYLGDEVRYEGDFDLQYKECGMQVKYLRNWNGFKTTTGKNKLGWKLHIYKDFKWLNDEIKGGNKGKRFFLMGWVHTDEKFSHVMPLGAKQGPNPSININRLALFPFVSYEPNGRINSVEYRYGDFLRCYRVTKDIDCVFLGQPEDKFHIAIYF